jgi:hypothetical protein
MIVSKQSQDGTQFHPDSAWLIGASGSLFKKKTIVTIVVLRLRDIKVTGLSFITG